MTVNGSAGLSVIVEFEKVSTDTINMTSTLTCPAPDLFTDARCGDHRTHFSCLFLTVLKWSQLCLSRKTGVCA